MEGVSVKYLAELAGKTERRIRQINNDLPDNEKLLEADDNGKYDPAFFVKRWVAYQIKQEGGKEESLDDIKAQHEKVKMEKSQIELGILKGEICMRADMMRLWGGMIKEMSGSLLSIPRTLAPRLTNIERPSEAEALLEQEVRAAMSALSKTPMPEEVKGDGPEGDMGANNGHARTAKEANGK